MKKKATAVSLLIALILVLLTACGDIGEAPASDFKYTIVAHSVRIDEYIGSDTRVRVPDMIENTPVKVIGHSAFRGSNVRSVHLPLELEVIGVLAFADCVGLTDIVIPDNVLVIDNAAFGECTGLRNVTLGSGVTEIQWAAFDGCTKLSESSRQSILNINPSVKFDSVNK